jgi:hypothetical protein
MPNVYAILGESDTRKSSTVRALTGVPMQYDAWSVATPTSPTGSIDVYVQIKALQEAEISAQDFVEKIDNVDQYRIKHGHRPVGDILIPLRISTVNGFPDGTVYLQHFALAGWNIKQIVVLGAAALPIALPVGVPAHLISYPTAIPPTNQIASYIRGWWNWL